jgi:integrase
MGRLVEGLNCSVHGFRSTFTDWAAEFGWDFELREIALAHAVSGATSQAYNRSKQVDRRRAMMSAWSAFACRGEAVGSPQAMP